MTAVVLDSEYIDVLRSLGDLESELHEAVHRYYEFIRPLGPEPYYSVLLGASHRVWAGEQAAITRSDLLGELEAETDIPTGVQMQIRSLLKRESP
jgi:hypothetical protein